MGEYASIYWAAACLALWAGRGGCNVTDGQLSDAVNMVCDEAELTLPQEALLKKLLSNMLKKGGEDGTGRHCERDQLGLIEGRPSLKKKVNCWNT